MHQLTDFLENLTLVLTVAAVISFVCNRLRLPVVLGYMLAGLIVGPHIPIPLVANSHMVHTLSELGVILLMFSLGLEFSMRRLMTVLPTAGAIAIIECGFMLWLGYVVGQLFGWSTLESIYIGAIIAISSTTIIVKAIADEKIANQRAQIVFGILIVEDVLAVLLLTILPVLSYQYANSGLALARTAGTLFMFLAPLIAIGLFTIPRLLRVVLRMNRPELTLVVSLGLCFAIALLVKKMGYSVALGAFIAGSLMAESGEEGYLNTLISPVRDMFVAIFFVSIGMMINPALIVAQWPIVLLLTGIVIVGKFLGVTVGTFLTGHSPRTAIRSGFSLGQIGEFSFIIAGMGVATGAIREFIYPMTIAISALTTITTPWLIRHSDSLTQWIDRRLPAWLQTFTSLYGAWIERMQRASRAATHRSEIRRLLRLLIIDTLLVLAILISTALSLDVLVARFSDWFGIPTHIARGIGGASAGIVLMPFAIGIIRCARSLGLLLATEALPLEHDGSLDLAAAPRRVLVVTLQLAIVLVFGVIILAITQPFLPSYYGAMSFAAILAALAIAFWKSAAQLQGHVRAGAGMILELLSSSIDKQREIQVPELQQFIYGLGSVHSVRLHAKSPAVGRTLAEIHLRGLTGASVIAITRKDGNVLVPDGHAYLHADDILAITGSDEAIQAAKELL